MNTLGIITTGQKSQCGTVLIPSGRVYYHTNQTMKPGLYKITARVPLPAGWATLRELVTKRTSFEWKDNIIDVFEIVFYHRLTEERTYMDTLEMIHTKSFTFRSGSVQICGPLPEQ